MPRRNDSPGRIAAAARHAPAARLHRARERVVEGNGASHARRFDLRARTNGFGRDSFGHGTMESFFMSEPLQAPSPLIPIPRAPAPEIPVATPRRALEITIDGKRVSVPEGATILDAARKLGIETPTLCFLETLTPVNVCRVCVVELEGSRTLVPACSRKVEAGMVIHTDSERVRVSRKMVLEFLSSSVDLSTWPAFREHCERYGANASRFEKNVAQHSQPVKIDNQLYVRDYAKCVLCYKCVQACGVEAQFTFAIGVA